MSDTILSGKLTVYYLDDTRRKQIKWTGTTDKDDTQKMIDVYDATEDLFTIPTQQDDGLIFSAETPGEYTIGRIDAGDAEPWFIDLKTMEHIIGDFANFTGCALKTSGWLRDPFPGNGSGTIGIVVVPVTNVNIDAADVGDTVSHGDGDSGTLLDWVDRGGTDFLFIRPDTNTLGDDFNTASGTITCGSGDNHTATQLFAAHTGEMVWGNPFSQGALLPDTHVFMYQDGERIVGSDQTDNDWWVDGHVDRAVPIKDYQTAAFPIIDEGYLTVKANQYGSKYTYAIIRMNTISGGNVSAGLSSGDDITNTTGYGSITYTNAADNFSVGDEILGTDSGARGIITQIDTPGAGQTVHYFLVGDPIVNFNTAVEVCDNEDDNGTGSKDGNVPGTEGPADTAWFDGASVPTYAYANDQVDITDDGNDEEYAIAITLNQCSLAQMHEYNKYQQRRGSVLDMDGLDGQEWIGLDYAINYATITGTVAEDVLVTGGTSGATGIVVSNPAGSANTATLRNTRGTFIDGEAIYENDGTDEFDASGLTVEVIVPVAESSLGTLAGTNFFASRGVVLIDYKAIEENLFSLIDVKGNPTARPTSISVVISNLLEFDYASVFRLTGASGTVDKTEYSAAGGEGVGDTTITVDGTIASDVPNKTNGGTLVLQDADDNGKEYVIRFSSFVPATGVVTLANLDIASLTSGDTTTLNESGVFGSTLVGDLVYNHDLDEISYVSVVTSANSVKINPAFSGDPTGDHVELNCVPITLIDTADNVYFMLVFKYKEIDGTASASMQYNVTDIYARLRVRNISTAAVKIKGYTGDFTITEAAGGIAAATRIENTVYGS